MKKLLLSLFLVFSFIGHAIDFQIPGDLGGTTADILMRLAPQQEDFDKSATEDPGSYENNEESDDQEPQVLNQKLVEGVGDPSRIDSFEKGLYVEETLLEAGLEDEDKIEEEKAQEKKKKEKDNFFDEASASGLLSTPDPLAENESIFSNSPFNEDITAPEGDGPSFDEIPL
ncbi:MAG: hypothetical protein EBQ92_08440 [Proteobacteria bacterium]|nr:hypothetical protein [Pseudomonadota bacterium]